MTGDEQILAWLTEYRGPKLPSFVDRFLTEHRTMRARVAELETAVGWWENAEWACIRCGYHNRGAMCTHCGRALGKAAVHG